MDVNRNKLNIRTEIEAMQVNCQAMGLREIETDSSKCDNFLLVSNNKTGANKKFLCYMYSVISRIANLASKLTLLSRKLHVTYFSNFSGKILCHLEKSGIC